MTIHRSVTVAALFPLLSVFLLGLCSCAKSKTDSGTASLTVNVSGPVTSVAAFDRDQVTGVAVSRSGRVFVSFPRWHDDFRGVSVAEVLSDGSVKPYPDKAWNAWRAGVTPGRRAADGTLPPDAANSFVCVQSVYVDAKDRLWILDPGSPSIAGVVAGAAKLIQVDLGSNSVVRVIPFSTAIAPEKSYLNDLRVDTRTEHVFITDSGLGGIVVLHLPSGSVKRVLDGHPSVLAESGFVPRIGGKEWKNKDGQVLQVHSDGIALDTTNNYLYWQALTGRTLYRLPLAMLKNDRVAPALLASRVENLGTTVMTDGMECDAKGNLYFSALEYGAVVRRNVDGTLQIISQGPDLAWPDTFAFGPAGSLYLTTSQIHLTKWFTTDGSQPRTPYRVLKLDLAKVDPRPLPVKK